MDESGMRRNGDKSKEEGKFRLEKEGETGRRRERKWG